MQPFLFPFFTSTRENSGNSSATLNTKPQRPQEKIPSEPLYRINAAVQPTPPPQYWSYSKDKTGVAVCCQCSTTKSNRRLCSSEGSNYRKKIANFTQSQRSADSLILQTRSRTWGNKNNLAKTCAKRNFWQGRKRRNPFHFFVRRNQTNANKPKIEAKPSKSLPSRSKNVIGPWGSGGKSWVCSVFKTKTPPPSSRWYGVLGALNCSKLSA